MKILIADNNPKSLAIARECLIEGGIDVKCVESGKQALEVAHQDKPDVVLLSVDMPDMSGLEAFRMLKDDDELCMIPVIFIAGTDDDINFIKEQTQRVVDYISKPFDVSELKARVKGAINNQQSQGQLIGPGWKPNSNDQDDIDVFDKKEAIEIIDDDEDFVKELAGMFINDFPGQIARMKEAINEKDNKALGKVAHELKGAVSNLGKKALFKTCLKLEELCEQGNMDEAVKTYDVLVLEAERLAKVLREYIKSE